MNWRSIVEALSGADLLARTRELAQQSCCIEADLLVLLGEVEERKLYLASASPSMFAFCVGELGFSEGAAYNRIHVARAGRELPAVIDAIRSGKVHLAGARLLVPHLTADNCGEILAEASGKSKRAIEEMVARLAPQPPAPTVIRQVPKANVSVAAPTPELALVAQTQLEASARCDRPAEVASARREEHRPPIQPLAKDTF